MSDSAILLISCPDRSGLVATITDFIFRRGGNILHLDQHVDIQQNIFFMRVEWDIRDFETPKDRIADHFQPIAEQYQMDWQLHFSGERQRAVIFVSKFDHCLYDVLSRWQSGEYEIDIPLIISNHATLEHVARQFDIAYHHMPISKATKTEQEQKQIALLKEHNVDLIILARYMQIVTETFVSEFPNKIINIHHSFLPAFPGAKPYHQAFERGVKLIGATSHYVTADLDAGPIIEQDTVHVDHRNSVSDMIRMGKDLEKAVLSRAIWHHLNHRILVYNNKTVVFK